MSKVNTMTAFFLPKRKFHRAWLPARASLTAGCNRIGCGHFFQVLARSIYPLPAVKAIVPDFRSMRSKTAWRTIAATDVSCRSASILSQASIGTENCISCLNSLLRFFGGAMLTKIAHGKYSVNEQLDCSQVNSHNMYEIMGELKVRRRA